MARIVEADLGSTDHRDAVVALTQAYALDPMGNGGPLPADAVYRLVPALQAHPTTLIFLAYEAEQPVGIATCFYGFSTFFAQRLLNVHDLAVLPAFRGRGIGRELLDAVTRKARDTGCCKVTLEVQEHNAAGRRLYAKAGFSQALSTSPAGGSLFYAKPL